MDTVSVTKRDGEAGGAATAAAACALTNAVLDPDTVAPVAVMKSIPKIAGDPSPWAAVTVNVL